MYVVLKVWESISPTKFLWPALDIGGFWSIPYVINVHCLVMELVPEQLTPLLMRPVGLLLLREGGHACENILE